MPERDPKLHPAPGDQLCPKDGLNALTVIEAMPHHVKFRLVVGGQMVRPMWRYRKFAKAAVVVKRGDDA